MHFFHFGICGYYRSINYLYTQLTSSNIDIIGGLFNINAQCIMNISLLYMKDLL
jgi:hypothetical protein